LDIRQVGAELFHTDGRTDGRTDRQTDRRKDMTKLVVAFRNFANEPKKNLCSAHIVNICVIMDFRTNSDHFPLHRKLFL